MQVSDGSAKALEAEDRSDWETAWSAHRAALNSDPKNPTTCILYASFMIRRRLGELTENEAALLYESFAYLAESHPELYGSFAALKAIFEFRIVGDFERAAKDFELGVAHLSLDPDSKNDLAICLFHQAVFYDSQTHFHDPNRALDAYRRALDLEPNHVESLNNAAALLVQGNRLDEAIPLLLRAEELSPGFPAYNLACAYAKASRHGECEKWLAKSADVDALPEDYASDEDFAMVRNEEWFMRILDESYDVTRTDENVELYDGTTVKLYRGVSGIEMTTGNVSWNASYVVLRFLEQKLKHQKSSVLDLSAGLGLVGCSLHALGHDVMMSEIGQSQLETLGKNVASNAFYVENPPVVFPFKWGEALQIAKRMNIVVASDLVYIAIRDGIGRELVDALVQCLRVSDTLLIAYEERVLHQESEFFVELQRVVAPLLVVEEAVAEEWKVDLCRQNESASLGVLFEDEELPSIRLFRITH